MADEEENASNDDGESGSVKTEKIEEAETKEKSKGGTSPGWATKTLRVFIFATLGAFLAAYLFANPLPNGLRVDFDLAASIKFGLIAGVISAVLRALASMLPIFSDD